MDWKWNAGGLMCIYFSLTKLFLDNKQPDESGSVWSTALNVATIRFPFFFCFQRTHNRCQKPTAQQSLFLVSICMTPVSVNSSLDHWPLWIVERGSGAADSWVDVLANIVWSLKCAGRAVEWMWMDLRSHAEQARILDSGWCGRCVPAQTPKSQIQQPLRPRLKIFLPKRLLSGIFCGQFRKIWRNSSGWVGWTLRPPTSPPMMDVNRYQGGEIASVSRSHVCHVITWSDQSFPSLAGSRTQNGRLLCINFPFIILSAPNCVPID